MTTSSRVTETRMLNILRDSNYANKYARKIDSRYLSPEGRMIYRAIVHLLKKANKYNTITTENVVLSRTDLTEVLEQLYPNQELDSVIDVMAFMSEFKADFKKPDVVYAIFEAQHSQAVLARIAAEASNQVQTNRHNLDRLREMLESDEEAGSLELVPIDYTKITEELNRIRIPTGLKNIDRELQGGLGVGELGVVGGAPKYGKTSLLVNLAGHEILRKRPVLYITLADIPGSEIALRVGCFLTGMDEDEFMKDGKTRDELQKLLKKSGAWFIPLDLQEQIHTLTMNDLHDYIQTAKNMYPRLRLVIVDRAEMIAFSKKNDDAFRHRVMHVYMDLRRIARSVNVAVWTDSQTSDEGRKSRIVTMGMGHESKVGKAQTLDIWMGYGKDPTGEESDNTRFITLEGRRHIKKMMHQVEFGPDYRLKEVYYVED